MLSESPDFLFINFSDVVSKIEFVKVDSHLTSAVAFFFDLCRQILENANVKYKHYHLLPKNPLLTFDANTDLKCEQGITSKSPSRSLYGLFTPHAHAERFVEHFLSLPGGVLLGGCASKGIYVRLGAMCFKGGVTFPGGGVLHRGCVLSRGVCVLPRGMCVLPGGVCASRGVCFLNGGMLPRGVWYPSMN